MVDRGTSRKFPVKHLSSGSTKSRKSSLASSEFDEEYRVELEGKYLGNGLEVRPPSGTNHQQPGSHLSIDTRLSELSLVSSDHFVRGGSDGLSSRSLSGSNKKTNPYIVEVNKPNCYIKSPFKQGYQVSKNGPSKIIDPGIELKRVTRDSIVRVRQQFRRPKPPSQPYLYAQRLKKAKLKTTGRPISGSGPSIQQCKGIRAGRQVVRRTGTPLVYFHDDQSVTCSHSVRPESSIHCTSRASSEADHEGLSDEVIDDDVIGSWIRHSPDEDLTEDLDPINNIRDQRDHSYSNIDLEDLINDPQTLDNEDENKDQDIPINPIRDQRDQSCDNANFKDNIQTPGNEDSRDCISNGSDLRQTNSTKTTTAKNDGRTCRPFSDSKDDDDDDDDNNKDIIHKRTLLSNFKYTNSRNSFGQNRGASKLDPGTNGKKKAGFNHCWNPIDGQANCLNEITCISIQPKLSSSLQNVIHEIERSTKDQPLNARCVHVVNSTSGDEVPVMTVHVRGKLENASTVMNIDEESGHNVNTGVKSPENMDIGDDHDDESYMYHAEDDGGDDDDDDDDDLDTDRIPSAVIWQNLDQLNLSMTESSPPTKGKLNFRSDARKVQSAGPRREASTGHSMSSGQHFELPKSEQRTKVSSSKARRTKANSQSEEVDKAELLRRYLSEESKKFSAELPGYFTEQFSIIQEGKKGKTLDGKAVEESCESIALLTYGGNKDEVIDTSNNDSVEPKDSDVHFEEVGSSTSFGVFFTVESTSTCDVDSISETLGTSSESRDFSDDTGFETMPGTGGIGTDMNDDEHQASKFSIKQDGQVRFNVKPEDLKVIAKAKLLTDPRSANAQYMRCPHEPLTFAINAIPPLGYLYYFAYGVDMNAKRMSLYLRRDYKRLWGVLFGFQLRFNKRGSSCAAGVFANVEFSPGSSVEGCVYTITDAELSMLDNCMGYPKHYSRAVLPVWMSNCHEPNLHGVAQYCVPAVLYVAEQQWIEPGATDSLDCTYSVSQCLKASDILTPNYVEFLNQQTN